MVTEIPALVLAIAVAVAIIYLVRRIAIFVLNASPASPPCSWQTSSPS